MTTERLHMMNVKDYKHMTDQVVLKSYSFDIPGRPLGIYHPKIIFFVYLHLEYTLTLPILILTDDI